MRNVLIAEVGLILLMALAVLGVFGPLVYADLRPGDHQAQVVSRMWQGAAQVLWAGVACLGLPVLAVLFVAARIRDAAAERERRLLYDPARLIRQEEAWNIWFEAQNGGEQ